MIIHVTAVALIYLFYMYILLLIMQCKILDNGYNSLYKLKIYTFGIFKKEIAFPILGKVSSIKVINPNKIRI